MEKLKIVWIDDEYKTLEAFIELADNSSIELIPFEFAKAGIEYIESNLSIIDGVILDARGWQDSAEEAVSLKGLAYCERKLNELKAKKIIPYCIYTGQTSLMSVDESFKELYADVKVFDKTSKDGPKDVLEFMAQSGKGLIDFQLREKYHDVFKVCTDDYTNNNHFNTMMSLLKKIHNPLDESVNMPGFNDLRKILESVFLKANEKGLLHDICVSRQSNVKLNDALRFMSGKSTNIYSTRNGTQYVAMNAKTYIKSLLHDQIKDIIDLTNAGSHVENNDDKRPFDEYKGDLDTNNLLFSVAFKLMDVLIWFKTLIDSHPHIDNNKSQWLDVPRGDWYKGVVKGVKNSGYMEVEYEGLSLRIMDLHPDLVSSENLLVGDIIYVSIDDRIRAREIKRNLN